MNHVAAYKYICSQLTEVQNLGFAELQNRIGTRITKDITSSDGKLYHVETTIDWDNPDQKAISLRTLVHDNNSFQFESLEESVKVLRTNER